MNLVSKSLFVELHISSVSRCSHENSHVLPDIIFKVVTFIVDFFFEPQQLQLAHNFCFVYYYFISFLKISCYGIAPLLLQNLNASCKFKNYVIHSDSSFQIFQIKMTVLHLLIYINIICNTFIWLEFLLIEGSNIRLLFIQFILV